MFMQENGVHGPYVDSDPKFLISVNKNRNVAFKRIINDV